MPFTYEMLDKLSVAFLNRLSIFIYLLEYIPSFEKSFKCLGTKRRPMKEIGTASFKIANRAIHYNSADYIFFGSFFGLASCILKIDLCLVGCSEA